MAEDTTIIDDLLDSTLDDLADLPEFKPFPPGAHRVILKFEKKTVNKHPSVELKLTAKETLELVNPTKDTPLEPGTETNVLYQLDNDFGQGKFKEALVPLGEHLGLTKLKDIMEAANGMEVTVVTTIRKNKDNPDLLYTSISNVIVD